MATAASIVKKIDAVLKKVSVIPGPVYKRVRTMVGGDALLGIGGTIVTTDTLFIPPPAIFSADDPSIREFYQSGAVEVGDLVCFASPTSVTPSDLVSKGLSIVTAGVDYKIVGYTPYHFGNAVVMYAIRLTGRDR